MLPDLGVSSEGVVFDSILEQKGLLFFPYKMDDPAGKSGLFYRPVPEFYIGGLLLYGKNCEPVVVRHQKGSPLRPGIFDEHAQEPVDERLLPDLAGNGARR